MWDKTVLGASLVRSSSSHIEFSPSPVLTLLPEEMRNTLAYDHVPVSRVSQEKHNESSTRLLMSVKDTKTSLSMITCL